jgi:hypothetical protein
VAGSYGSMGRWDGSVLEIMTQEVHGSLMLESCDFPPERKQNKAVFQLPEVMALRQEVAVEVES